MFLIGYLENLFFIFHFLHSGSSVHFFKLKLHIITYQSYNLIQKAELIFVKMDVLVAQKETGWIDIFKIYEQRE